MAGLEPARPCEPQDFKSWVSADSTTSAKGSGGMIAEASVSCKRSSARGGSHVAAVGFGSTRSRVGSGDGLLACYASALANFATPAAGAKVAGL